MAKTIIDAIILLRAIKEDHRKKIPDEIAKMMFDQTKENFYKQSYNNDNKSEKWPERIYEKKLTYPKLRYTSAMFRSIKPFSNSNKAGIGSNIPYTKKQNEGAIGNFEFIRPEYGIYIKIRKILPRKFMGIGEKTINETKKIILRYWNKRFK